jgi:hypothetical protein
VPAVMLAIFALTLFVSACLLFIIEPMVGKMMLPLMGGTPAVWNTCMVFFQAFLLAGYGYAHASIKWLSPRGQARLHLAVLALPFLSFLVNSIFAAGALAPYETLVAGHEGNPIPVLLLVLTLSVGLPFFVVCTSAPTLTRWFSSTNHPAAQDPYFLYGASNLGSILALVAYPFLIEPYFALFSQTVGWVASYALLLGLVALCAWMMWRSDRLTKGQLSTFNVPDRILDGVGAGLFVIGAALNLYFFLGAAMWGLGFCLFRGRWLRAVSPAAADFVSATQPEPEAPPAPVPASQPVSAPSHSSGHGGTAVKTAPRAVTHQKAAPAPAAAAQAVQSAAPAATPAADKPVTWERRIRWIALAAVPSSLMLGVTTYITTDIAAIPLLWMPPLILYLLTFIIVFAVISTRTQNVVTFAGVVQIALLGAFFGIPFFFESETIRFFFVLLGFAAVIAGAFLLRMRDNQLIHRSMIILMPLLLLLMLFMMLSEIKPDLIGNILLHLGTLFIVAMVCHGELAADRPAPQHLTEFFLLMSVGGVIGGLFNALVAPVVFNSIVEYQLMMIVACLLLPALGRGAEGAWARWVDVALGGTILLIGLILLVVTFGETIPAKKAIVLLLCAGPALWAGAVACAVWQARRPPSNEWLAPSAGVGGGVLLAAGLFAAASSGLGLSVWTVLLSLSLILVVGLWCWSVLYAAGRSPSLTTSDLLPPSLTLLPVFCSLGVLLLLLASGFKVKNVFDPRPFTEGTAWMWVVVGIAVAVLVWLPTMLKRLRQPAEPDGRTTIDYRLSVVLDLLMPLALLVLVFGLYWGLPSPAIKGRIEAIAGYLNSKKMAIRPEHLMGVLTFGLPAVLCYTFVERWSRFGLGVGALLLAAGVSMTIKEGVMYQDRSFFGVLKVEDSYSRYPEDTRKEKDYQFPYWPVHRLVHGTTLHGKQFIDADVRDTPLSYYHRSGPVGQTFRMFNTPPVDDKGQPLRDKQGNLVPPRPYAVIGLGTGTMASYGQPGQRVDFYDIDPVVVDISYDTNEFFHFVEDAQERGVDIGLILGDARLTFDPRDWRERKKISQAPATEEPPSMQGAVKQKRLLPLGKRPWHKGHLWFARMDNDRDGYVSRKEFLGTKEEFDAIDADGDGLISSAEAKAFKPRPPARRYGTELTSDVKYRLIVVDAFSSDAIPVHLITRQALQIYKDRLADDGVLCIHISNRYLDLQPVLANIATQLNLVGVHMSDDENDAPGKSRSHWVMLSRKQEVLDKLNQVQRWQYDPEQLPLLAVALYPTMGIEPNHAGALAYAAQALGQIQDTMAAQKTEEPGRNPADGLPAWEPLETTDYLRELPAKNKKEIERIAPIQAGYREETDGLVAGLVEYVNKVWERPEVKKDNAEVKKALDAADQEYKRALQLVAEDYADKLKGLEKDSEASLKKVTDASERSAKEDLLALRKEGLRREMEGKKTDELQRYTYARMDAWMEPDRQLSARLREIVLQMGQKDTNREDMAALQVEHNRLKKEQQKFASVKEGWDKERGKFEARKLWLDRLSGRLSERTRTLASRANRSFEKVRTNERVGVWTDDFANILSIFNWGR